MPTIEGRVPTPRADRYLAQLCDHLGQLGHAGPSHGRHGGGRDHGSPPVVRRVERDGNRGEIEFDWGVVALTATPSELVVTVDAGNPEALARGRELIGRRLETIGRRDGLAVTWRLPDPG